MTLAAYRSRFVLSLALASALADNSLRSSSLTLRHAQSYGRVCRLSFEDRSTSGRRQEVTGRHALLAPRQAQHLDGPFERPVAAKYPPHKTPRFLVRPGYFTDRSDSRERHLPLHDRLVVALDPEVRVEFHTWNLCQGLEIDRPVVVDLRGEVVARDARIASLAVNILPFQLAANQIHSDGMSGFGAERQGPC